MRKPASHKTAVLLRRFAKRADPFCTLHKEDLEAAAQTIDELHALAEQLRADIDRLRSDRTEFAMKFASDLAAMANQATADCFDHPEKYPSLLEMRGLLKGRKTTHG